MANDWGIQEVSDDWGIQEVSDDDWGIVEAPETSNLERMTERLATRSVQAGAGLLRAGADTKPAETLPEFGAEIAEKAGLEADKQPGLMDAMALPGAAVRSVVDYVGSLSAKGIFDFADLTAAKGDPTEQPAREWVRQNQPLIQQEAKDILGDPNMQYQGGTGEKFGWDVAEATVNMVPMLAAGWATRNPGVTLGVMGMQVGGNTYADYMDKTGDHDKAMTAAKFHVAAEIIPETIPVMAILRKPIAGEGVTRMLEATIGEGAQEVITSILQQTYDRTALENMTLKDAILNIDWSDAAYEGLIGVFVGGTLATPGAIADAMTKPAETPPTPEFTPETFEPVTEVRSLQENATVIEQEIAALDETAPAVTEQERMAEQDEVLTETPLDVPQDAAWAPVETAAELETVETEAAQRAEAQRASDMRAFMDSPAYQQALAQSPDPGALAARYEEGLAKLEKAAGITTETVPPPSKVGKPVAEEAAWGPATEIEPEAAPETTPKPEQPQTELPEAEPEVQPVVYAGTDTTPVVSGETAAEQTQPKRTLRDVQAERKAAKEAGEISKGETVKINEGRLEGRTGTILDIEQDVDGDTIYWAQVEQPDGTTDEEAYFTPDAFTRETVTQKIEAAKQEARAAEDMAAIRARAKETKAAIAEAKKLAEKHKVEQTPESKALKLFDRKGEIPKANMVQLKQALRELGLPVSGKKAEIQKRLKAWRDEYRSPQAIQKRQTAEVEARQKKAAEPKKPAPKKPETKPAHVSQVEWDYRGDKQITKAVKQVAKDLGKMDMNALVQYRDNVIGSDRGSQGETLGSRPAIIEEFQRRKAREIEEKREEAAAPKQLSLTDMAADLEQKPASASEAGVDGEYISPAEWGYTVENFPAPERGTVSAIKRSGKKYITPEQARVIHQSWNDYAERIAREEDHSNEVVISLFDHSKIMGLPWKQAGYEVYALDIKNDADLARMSPTVLLEDIKEAGQKVVAILAQPPCTTFACSGARWWKDRHDKIDMDLVEKMFGPDASEHFSTPKAYNKFLVSLTDLWIELFEPEITMLENPIGRIRTEMGLPDPTLVFNPNNYGDPYTKATQLWGNFNPDLPTANVEPTEGSKIHKLSGKSEKESGARSETSEPFAYAFFVANNTSNIPYEKPNVDAKPLNKIELSAEFDGEIITQTADQWLAQLDERIEAVLKLRGCA